MSLLLLSVSVFLLINDFLLDEFIPTSADHSSFLLTFINLLSVLLFLKYFLNECRLGNLSWEIFDVWIHDVEKLMIESIRFTSKGFVYFLFWCFLRFRLFREFTKIFRRLLLSILCFLQSEFLKVVIQLFWKITLLGSFLQIDGEIPLLRLLPKKIRELLAWWLSDSAKAPLAHQ